MTIHNVRGSDFGRGAVQLARSQQQRVQHCRINNHVLASLVQKEPLSVCICLLTKNEHVETTVPWL
ncbi:hypothetical protein GCM10022631_25760 [Deinococcus rubellus]|uniref:hypothetical protein n=1 Tax=Deinococcus rubellus TaxID=1889240 RepID=UPI0031EEC661